MSRDNVGTAPALGRLRALPRIVFRYLKRLISLPWNFQKLYDEALPQQLEQVRRDLATMLDWQTQRLTWLAEQLEQVRVGLAGPLERQEQRFAAALERQEQQFNERADAVMKDVRQLRYRFAEFYGALVEELRRLKAERQEPQAQEKQGHGRAA
jgi:hypothetical protein